MNQRAILHIIFAVIGIPVLLTIGIWSATDPLYAGIATLIVVGLAVLTQLGQRCWLLIPLCAPFTGAMTILPGSFAPRDLAVGLVAILLPPLWVMRRFPLRIRLGSLEIGLLVMLVFVGQAYLRNPVGLSIFGSGTIGGRPYFEIAVSTVAFVILSTLVVEFKNVRLMVFANILGSVLSAIYTAVMGLFPAVAVYGLRFYNSGGVANVLREYYSAGYDPSQGSGRMPYLSKFGTPFVVMVLAFRSPLQLLMPRNFFFTAVICFAGVCILLSGFRAGVAGFGMLGIAAFFLYRKPIHLLLIAMLGAPILGVLLVAQGAVFDLPLPAQRALSFLPADWDRRAVVSAEGSSEWRYLMWREALTSERHIRNKWVGDGFGFTSAELAYQQELMVRGVHTVDQQDYYLATGTYHSGPIETIKRIGYLGLASLLIVMGVFFRHAVGLVRRARGTPYFPYAMFLALPAVIAPFYFVLVFGAFQSSLTALLLGGGMMRLVGNSMDAWMRSRAAAEEREARVQPRIGGGLARVR